MNRLCLALFVVFCGFSRPADAQGPPYTFTKLQVPGSVFTDATGINNAGRVVGTYYSSNGVRRGYVFDGHTYTTIDFPGAAHTFIFGIGGSGSTVGSYTTQSGGGLWHGVLETGGTFTVYDFPGQETDGRAINASGQIVGIYNNGPGTPDTGYLKIAETYTAINFPGAQHTYAFGINDAGTITGTYVAADGLHGFIRAGGTFSAINFPGATQTFVGGINNQDKAVGWSRRGLNPAHGFVVSGTSWRAFDVDLPGVVESQPQALNDSGQVVGNYSSAECPQGCAFLATPRTDVLPSCDQALSLQYSAGTLKMKFTGLRTSAPLTWAGALLALNTRVPLWSAPLPAVSPALSFDLSFAFPAVGPVLAWSTLSRASGDVICVDFATVNTGG